MFYKINNKDAELVEDFLQLNDIQYEKELYLCEMYGRELADDVLCCMEEEIQHVDRQEVIQRVGKAFSESDFMAEIETDFIMESIFDIVESLDEIVIDTSHLEYSKDK